MGFLIDIIHSHLLFTPPLPTTKFTNQIIIVTGSNCVLGLEAARHFVRLDAADNVANASIEASEKRAGVVEVWHLDLSNYESVKTFAKKCEGLERLDVLVENAGIVTERFVRTEEDESTITTNVVSTFLLALLVLPKLRETAERFNVVPRLSVVASFTHWLTKFPEGRGEKIFETLADPEKVRMDDIYNISKLMEIYTVRTLAALISSSKKPAIILNCLNPGWVVTEVMREWTGLRLLIFKINRTLFARRTDVGARTLVAAAEAGQESHGMYMDDSKVGKVAPFNFDEEGLKVQEKVWKELSEKLERILPGILQNI
ncbi:hypothetical protein MMC30_005809 [Trapelia coarctata]|nr:hypothetical protein [Trapelia coarctata]